MSLADDILEVRTPEEARLMLLRARLYLLDPNITERERLTVESNSEMLAMILLAEEQTDA